MLALDILIARLDVVALILLPLGFTTQLFVVQVPA
jgi:hypothetical protein